jgi:hypothetical protein
MLDVSLENLTRECDAAIKKCEDTHKGVKESKLRYQGPDRSGTDDENSAENVEFQVISTRIPKLIFDVPAVRCDSPLIDSADEVAMFDLGFNRWIHESDTRQVLHECAVDFSFNWTCILVSRRPAAWLGQMEMKGGTGVPDWPYMQHIPTEQAFKDHLASGPYTGRFAGHTIVADKEDLLRQAEAHPEEKWNVKVIEALADDAGVSSVRRQRGDGPTRREVAYRQVHVPDAEIDWETECLMEDGSECPEDKRHFYNGRLFYLPVVPVSFDDGRKKKASGFIRESEPYFGPPSGPYVFGFEHVVPGDPYGMSTLTPNGATIRLLNEVTTTINEGVISHKVIGILNEFAEGLEDIVANGKNGHLYTSSGFDKSMVESLELGGVSNQSLVHAGVLRDRTDRGLGMDDGQYGRADDQASATAVAVAADSAGDKTGQAKHQFTDFVQRAFKIVGFYIWNDEKFAMHVSIQQWLAMGRKVEELIKRDAKGNPILDEQGQPKLDQPTIFGGTDKPRSYASLQMTIEPFSMERMSEQVAARNAATLTATVATIAPLVIQAPFIRWDLFFKAMGKYTRIPEMEHLINMPAAAEMAQSQVLAQYAQALTEQKPELAGSSGSPAPPKGPQSMQPAGAQKAQPAAAPKPSTPGGLQGRSTGGQAGDRAKAQVGAA